MTLTAGASSRVINPSIGDDLAGQLYRRVCTSIRDDLEANVLYLVDGETAFAIVSLDLLGYFPNRVSTELGSSVAAALGMPAHDVIISCTHTHAGPAAPDLLIDDGPENSAYVRTLTEALVACACDAKTTARDARAGAASGRAHIGFNRRLTWADGTHTMYGDASRSDFCGLEGPDDPSHAVLHVTDAGGNTLAFLHSNCCHATVLESAECASADFPGEARRLLRERIGRDVPVLYLQGASGDTSPWNMIGEGRYDQSTRLEEIGALLADETVRLVDTIRPEADVALRHTCGDLKLNVRLPSEDELARARRIRELGEHEAGRWEYVLATRGVLRLQEVYGNEPTDSLRLHAIRIGECAIATNPCELYC